MQSLPYRGMSERVRKSGDGHSLADAETSHSEVSEGQVHDLVDDIDALLDRIDEVLESDAEEFVKNYVQKGGQ